MSEIARLKRQIEQECEAMKQAMTGFRMTASHEMINNQYNNIGDLQKRLETVIGKQEATVVIVEMYMKVVG